MLNKKVTSLCLLALMGGNFIVGSGAVFADEGKSEQKETIVTYDNRNAINDPDQPLNPFYVITTPGNVTFTDDQKTFDGAVEMTKPDGSAYDGNGVAKVQVESNNKFELQLKDGSDKVAYDFSYASQPGDSTIDAKLAKEAGFQELIPEISAAKAKYNVRYTMTGKATKTGAHTDTLTYKVISTTKATS
ncbi:hypothetical protein [Enterococcus hirae]|uniref:hypothetical protein n=1 Tax=Enterococcus hirae TaxID=1354 RepID=UPI001377D67F|nr:hypothetical protein [Enterococcus hirae]NBA40644.1 hypothetical protein [Enterococcus hirae]NBA56622.1 hypothetical protein [Enterococcus hirae]